MEHTLEDEKDELGLSYFEVRRYDAIMRHFAVTQVSHLFLARQTKRLRREKPGDRIQAAEHENDRFLSDGSAVCAVKVLKMWIFPTRQAVAILPRNRLY